MTRKEVWELSAEEFFTHIITIICDYAKINGYEITDAVKTIGESLSEITEIATFDNWEINEEALGKDINVTSKWIPVEERLPEEDKYILLSFANFTVPAIVRYEENNDGSGNFYLGDEDKTLLSYGLIVNAWMPLPEPYKEE